MKNEQLINKFLKVNKHIKDSVRNNNVGVAGYSNLEYSNNKTEDSSASDTVTTDSKSHYNISDWSLTPPFTTTLVKNGAYRYFYNKNWSKFPEFSGLLTHKQGSASMDVVEDIFVDRNHSEFSRMFAGLERDGVKPNMNEIYLQLKEGEFQDFLERNAKVKGEKLSQAESLWEKYVTGDTFSDIISASSESQKNIIFNDRYLTKSVLIHGYAGTGKTYVLNELSQKVNESVNLYPNIIVKQKSEDFFKEVDAKKVECFTFEEFDLKIKKYIDQKVKALDSYRFKEWYTLFVGETEKMEVLSGVNVGIKPLLKNVKSKIKIKLEYKRVKNKNIDVDYVTEILNALDDYDYEISQLSKMKDELIEGLEIKTISIDEAPLVEGYKYLNAFTKDSINDLHYIVSYDRYQHDESQVFESIENVEVLNEVYRTTKEIFGLATNNVGIVDAIIPISMEHSVQISQRQKYENVIRLSEFCENYQDYIGNEYLELSIDIDVNPNEVDSKFIYILFTRAIARVSVFGKFKEEVRLWM